MFGKEEQGPLKLLKKRQAELSSKTSLLQSEVRRLREEISTIEVCQLFFAFLELMKLRVDKVFQRICR